VPFRLRPRITSARGHCSSIVTARTDSSCRAQAHVEARVVLLDERVLEHQGLDLVAHDSSTSTDSRLDHLGRSRVHLAATGSSVESRWRSSTPCDVDHSAVRILELVRARCLRDGAAGDVSPSLTGRILDTIICMTPQSIRSAGYRDGRCPTSSPPSSADDRTTVVSRRTLRRHHDRHHLRPRRRVDVRLRVRRERFEKLTFVPALVRDLEIWRIFTGRSRPSPRSGHCSARVLLAVGQQLESLFGRGTVLLGRE